MKEKIDFFINKLKKLPECRNDEFYRLADYVELKCLMNSDEQYSISEFIDDAKQRAEDLGEGDFEDNQIIRRLANAQKTDKWETIAKDTYRVIESRISLFGELYAFELTDNKRAIKLKSQLNMEKLYIFLLLCSDLRYTIKFKKELTSSFEIACLEVFDNILPTAEVHLFGSSNYENPDIEWKSDKLWDKLEWLEDFLVEKLNVEKKDISKYDKGDRGIDLVGKIDLGDNLSHFPLFFAQCACSPHEWVTKQDSMKFDAWNELITLSTNSNYFMFIPQSFRDSKGVWHDRTKIRRTVLFDRYRILSNFQDQDKFRTLSSYEVVNEIIKIKESVF